METLKFLFYSFSCYCNNFPLFIIVCLSFSRISFCPLVLGAVFVVVAAAAVALVPVVIDCLLDFLFKHKIVSKSMFFIRLIVCYFLSLQLSAPLPSPSPLSLFHYRLLCMSVRLFTFLSIQ